MVMAPQRFQVSDRYVRRHLGHYVGEPAAARETAGAGPARAHRQQAAESAEQATAGLAVHLLLAGQATDQLPDLGREVGGGVALVAAAGDVVLRHRVRRRSGRALAADQLPVSVLGQLTAVMHQEATRAGELIGL